MSPIFGIVSASLTANYDFGSMFPIRSYVVPSGGTTSTFTFDNIPQTYSHLQLRFTAGSNGSFGDDNWTRLIINGTTTAANNYTRHELYGYNSAITGGASINNSNDNLYFLVPGTIGSGWACGISDFFDYTNTNKYKTVKTLIGWDNNASNPAGTAASGRINLTSHLYLANTNAITSIRVDMYSGDYFRQYTQFALYGVKA